MAPWGRPLVNEKVRHAVQALRRGEIILIYDADGREEETDMVVASAYATPETIRTMRRDAGGLICTALAPEDHTRLGLPFLTDLLDEAAAEHPVLAAMAPDDVRYDASKPAFGLTINHRDTFTGITDDERSLTITELACFLEENQQAGDDKLQASFGTQFRAPGHCILLNGAPGGLATRQGHTELSLEMARQAGLVPTTTVCEMLDDRSGRALSRKAAEAYAQENSLVFLTGKDVLDAWQAQQNKANRPATKTANIPAPTSA